MSKPKKKNRKLNNGRDHLKVRLIQGATKAGVHKDKRKDEEKYKAREKVETEKCRQCGFPFPIEDDHPEAWEQHGFCSDSCMDYFTES